MPRIEEHRLIIAAIIAADDMLGCTRATTRGGITAYLVINGYARNEALALARAFA